MGLTGSTTADDRFDDVRVPVDRRARRARARACRSPWPALDAGRLGITAVAVGLAQAALDFAVGYAKEREAFGRPIIEHQGLSFLLADMAAAVESARATYLRRRPPQGRRQAVRPAGVDRQAGRHRRRHEGHHRRRAGARRAGYTRDFPVERYMREAKVMQIFEGTNQIQRMVIGRDLAR